MDIVYLWVNGCNEMQAKIRQQWESKLCATNKSETIRYTDHEELKYSLRSVYLYAQWIRHIFIVISDSDDPPTYLNKEPKQKITIIRHSEIFQKEFESDLPTFNSTAIESHIHKIPGLSDIFLYANDDCFFGRETHEWMFRQQHKIAMFIASGELPEGKSIDLPNQDLSVCALGNSRQLIENYCPCPNRAAPNLLLHQIKVLHRKSMEWAWEHKQIKKSLQETSAMKFRQKNMIDPVTLFVYAAYHLNAAIPCPRMEIYSMYLYLTSDMATNHKTLADLVRKRPILFCLNDGFSDKPNAEEITKLIQGTLIRYLRL